MRDRMEQRKGESQQGRWKERGEQREGEERGVDKRRGERSKAKCAPPAIQMGFKGV